MPVKLDAAERLFQPGEAQNAALYCGWYSSGQYVQAFPVPEVFFGLLVGGYLTLAECYAASTPWLSWRMVLVGDPLYRPFASVGRKPG
jgi:hypothetical protein